jgi:hypothetical protein
VYESSFESEAVREAREHLIGFREEANSEAEFRAVQGALDELSIGEQRLREGQKPRR